jgi:lysosomal-associated membrane protein 1/2
MALFYQVIVAVTAVQLIGTFAQNETNTSSTLKTVSSSISTTIVSTASVPTTRDSTTVSTTTAAASTTTAPTPPSDKPVTGNWNYTASTTNGTATYCIISHMAVLMTFNYTKTDNKTAVVKYAIPANAAVTGACGFNGSKAYIELTFFEDWTLQLDFKNETTKKYAIEKITLSYSVHDKYFPNITSTDNKTAEAMLMNQTIGEAPLGNVYSCKSEELLKDFTFTPGTNVFLQAMTMSDVKLSAYQNVTTKDDGYTLDYYYCADDSAVNNLVPIIVGAALAGLVLIVLIAYLIGRKRRQTGYESV